MNGNPITGVESLSFADNSGDLLNWQVIEDDGAAPGLLNNALVFIKSGNAFAISSTGQLAANQYGAGTFGGNATYNIAVDVNGNFVETSVGALATRTESSTYVATVTDGVILCDASGAAFDVDLPTVSGNSGKVLHIKKIDATANAITIDPFGAQTIDGQASIQLTAQYETVMLVSDGTEWWVI
jgi:hypothetical protein